MVLGADTRLKIIERLINNGLLESLVGDFVGAVDGISVHWVLSLSEDHCTLYAADVEGSRVLIVQDSDAQTIATIPLSPPMRERWLFVLRRAL